MKDSDQSALAFGAKVSVKQQIWKKVYAGEYYVYTDSRANLDAYSFRENTLGVFLGINWTGTFSTEIGYEFSHGDSFRSLGGTRGPSEGKGGGKGEGGEKGGGKRRRYSAAFGNEVIREKVDRHSVGVAAGADLTRSIFSQISYAYTITKGDHGTSRDHQGFISLGFRF